MAENSSSLLNQEILNAYEVIKEGGIILYPTDTVWGIGCDATNPDAVAKIYKLKQRAETQSMIVLMNGEKMMYNVFKNIPEVAWQILDLSEKPTTLILDDARNVAHNVISADKSLGVRLVKEPFCYKLMERMKKPLVSTSANISGQPTPMSFKEINPEIIKGVDYVVKLNQDKVAGKPSTIIKLTNDSQVKIIRK
ncbi:L-threonylcarbamoyladenylate synthase [Flavobacterium foetidum]|uniref:L-threonylcarbamoyladenylate synthase n=1 Tax=Flavobacterium foetidum TaxID=2026681 RepID=UPI001074B972|nr:L-threonylcarbamoyladenylate synthase [Flavobacterium foetidum]KAF2517788.1 threonylcarbamoyl-AMP synthase [Flavobacterium foetidum]